VTDADSKSGERIAKVLARAGVCSRRDAERLIADGRVSVNGKTLSSPALNVTVDDDIRVNGKQVAAAEPTRLWRYHKPSGLITTNHDPQGRASVFDNLPATLPRVISVGRLDLTSEGLLLLTNDGELARRMELPATGWLRRYRVRAYGRTTQEALDALRDGVEVAGVRYGPITALLEREQGANLWIAVSLTEGKNREVRKVLEALGLKVNRLIRIAYGPFQLGALASGAVEEVPKRALAAALGDAPPKGHAVAKRKPRKKRAS
jgi:23S rRNA pseudouridine2605 synthase